MQVCFGAAWTLLSLYASVLLRVRQDQGNTNASLRPIASTQIYDTEPLFYLNGLRYCIHPCEPVRHVVNTTVSKKAWTIKRTETITTRNDGLFLSTDTMGNFPGTHSELETINAYYDVFIETFGHVHCKTYNRNEPSRSIFIIIIIIDLAQKWPRHCYHPPQRPATARLPRPLANRNQNPYLPYLPQPKDSCPRRN